MNSNSSVRGREGDANEEREDVRLPGVLICSESKVNWVTSPWFLYGYYEQLPDHHARYI